jgi:outer membrane protein assembly factor BamB
MNPLHSFSRILLLCVSACLSGVATLQAADDPTATAKTLLELSGTTGGIVVHLGAGDGRLTAALAAGEGFTVHGLEADPAKVAAARKMLLAQGLYGRVSVEQFSGKRLSYTENLVNLVVVEDIDLVESDEVLRVLAPDGAFCARENDQWICVRKPRPDNIDAWTHFLHGPNNNAVADDDVVGQPRSLQWLAAPLWLRSHETPSGIQSPVSDGKRLFYYFDEGLIGIADERLPDRWSLICRDAFNGRQLWRRPLGNWGWREWAYDRFAGKDWTELRAARTSVPDENQRRIVAVGDRVYATLEYRGSVTILDGATGNTITEVQGTAGTSEILVTDGKGVAYLSQLPQELAKRRGDDTLAGAALVGFDAGAGKVLWRHESGPIRPLALAVDNGRVVYLSAKNLTALDLENGAVLWSVAASVNAPKTMLVVDDVIVMQGGPGVAAFDATDGSPLWQKKVLPIGGGEGEDLFVIDRLVWRGMSYATEEGEETKQKSPNVVVVGWDLRSGEEKDRIHVNNLRSPEHHHRCYRNKATSRYLISSYEGAEYLDFQADDHGMNNFVRGACRYGMTPCNGMLYAPPDQCFCQPGAKLLGYAALKRDAVSTMGEVDDADRLTKGPAFGKVEPVKASPADWPTFRCDARRRGSTPAAVAANVSVDWKAELGGKLTAPVVADGKLFVAQPDAHTIHALDTGDGKPLWSFTASGRVDSPPTFHDGTLLAGSADGRVYCLRASDGALVWQFLAAPADVRVAAFDQIESVWPVHGNVLVDNGVAYLTAGRSTYLDGGIRVYGLDPATGRIVHKGLLEGPHRSIDGERDYAFYILGANSDVLVSEGGFVYMRQKKMTPELEEVPVDVLSSKGEQDVGLHVFSTAGLLDDSWYNRTFWMYSGRWPGFQLANQAPKTGQLLVVDDERTYALRVFYRRNVHSPMFFPGNEGYLLFADLNTNEPQIVGEPGARPPVRWLPQSDYARARPGEEMRTLDSEAFGLDKMIGYTRAEPTVWQSWLPIRIRAMVKAGDVLFVAGAPDVLDENDPFAAFEDRLGASLVAVSAADGKQLSELKLDSPPVFDGLIAAGGRLFICQRDGQVLCLRGE